MEAQTRRISLRIPAMVRTTAEVLPIYKELENAANRDPPDERSYQEHNGSVQHESNQGVGDESHDTKRVNIVHRHARDIGEEGDNAVGDGAGGSIVVERDKRVHLELGRAEETLDHDQTEGLEDDTADLDDETKHVELDLTERGDHNTDDNDGDIAEGLEVGWGNAEGPGSQQGSNSIGGLEHLDEGDTQVEVGEVTADQGQAEHDTDGHNGAAVRVVPTISPIPAISTSQLDVSSITHA